MNSLLNGIKITQYLIYFIITFSIELYCQVPQNEFITNGNQFLLNSDLDSAKVFIQDSLVGYTPLELLNFPTGTYNIQFVKENQSVNKYNVSYTNGKYLEITGIFKTGYALLTIYSSPDSAKVLINDTLIGYTPLNKKYLKTNVYNLSVEKDGYSSWKQRINLHSSLYHYDVKLQNYYGNVSILKSNENQQFRIDNIYKNLKNNVPLKLSIGTHKISINSKDYHKSFEEQFIINPDDNYLISFNYNEKTLGPFFTSMLIPGLGQYLDNNQFKGEIFLTTNIILGGLSVWFSQNYTKDYNNYQNKIEKYQNETNEFLIRIDKADMDKAYKKSKTSLVLRNIAIGSFITAYLFNLVDAYLNHSIGGSFTMTPNINTQNNLSSIFLKVIL